MKSEKVKVQLKWTPSAQFSGILVALQKGFFKQEGIDVELIPGGPGVTIENRLADKTADIGISSLDSLMVYDEKGFQLVSIAQIHQKSSMGLVTFRSSGIDTPARMAGKKIGTFDGSNQFQLLAFLNKYHLTHNVELILQPSINDFLSGKVDVGIFTTYYGLQTLIEEGASKTDLNFFIFKYEGVGMLQDTIIVRKQWLENHRDLAIRFVRAVLKGWRFSIRHPKEAANIVIKYVPEGSTTAAFQLRMLRVLRGILMPTGFGPCDIGRFNRASVQKTADILFKYDLVRHPVPIRKVIRPSIVEEALKDCKESI
ncbi:MAG TPA: ABC transporter substrate-binding protein [Bacillales bacterium]|nr:ABC transporter substrate-binding protein [Bacillales bacterium]